MDDLNRIIHPFFIQLQDVIQKLIKLHTTFPNIRIYV